MPRNETASKTAEGPLPDDKARTLLAEYSEARAALGDARAEAAQADARIQRAGVALNKVRSDLIRSKVDIAAGLPIKDLMQSW
jgi:hypothetical protein